MTRVRSPSEAAGSVSRDGAAKAATPRPRLEEEDLTKSLPIAEPGRPQRSAAAAAMRTAAEGSQWHRRVVGAAAPGGRVASVEGCATNRRASSPRQGEEDQIFQAQL